MSEGYRDNRIIGGNFKKVTDLVHDWLEVHVDERFTLEQVCKDLQIQERENRKSVAIVLNRCVSQGKLEKVSNYSNSIYRYINNTCKYIDWVNSSGCDFLEVRWPYGIDDSSQFGFDKRAMISPGDIIVIAGTSNMGKTAFCLNFLWENMDSFPCTLMGNEYTPGKFRRRVSRMTWKDPMNEKGEAKFELIDRRENWKDIVRPDNINIIDWLNLGDNWYEIGKIIDGIQSKLKGGMALISIQKDEHKTLGRGAGFSEELASLYLVMDFERLLIRKCKEWREWNPNGKLYGFKIVDGGVKFHNIRQIIKCRKCWGTGKARDGECEVCNGTGYIDA